jgi:heat shock protein beta
VIYWFWLQLRNAKEVAKEDYNTFYKSTFKEFIDPQAYAHFTTEVCSSALS